MKKIILAFLFAVLFGIGNVYSQYRDDISPKVVLEFNVGTPISGFRCVPVQIDKDGTLGMLVVYHEKSGGGGPNPEFFRMPEGTISFVMFDMKGNQLWRKDLGKNVMPNTNYVPVLPFDLDGDGVDEIWFVNNTDKYLPLAASKYVVQAIDANTGDSLRSFKWPNITNRQPMGNLFRNFLMGGYVDGKPVLVTGQGTYAYGPMALHAYDPSLNNLWKTTFKVGAPGPRGSHMSAIVDLDMDGNDEIMWGERCISMKDGKEKFISDGNRFTGHTDIVQPVMNWEENRWYLYCCRENGETPRLVLLDDKGNRIWSDLEGHVDKGWVARFTEDGRWLCSALEIGKKFVVDNKVTRTNQLEFAYDLMSGERIELPFEGTTSATPVDINGDGIHELIYRSNIIDIKGNKYKFKGKLGHVSKIMKEYPGEQIVTYEPATGIIRVYANDKGFDAPNALRRYEHPFYKRNQKMTAVSANEKNLSGL